MKQKSLSTKPAKSDVIIETFLQKDTNKPKSIRVSRIKINQDFINHMPRSDKLAAKYDYTKNQIRINRKYGRNRNLFQSKIILDKKNNLVDGYISYLIAKMFGIKKVDIIIRENQTQQCNKK